MKAWSALYWLCLALVFSLPVILDTTIGVPYTAASVRLPFLYVGMLPGVAFAFVHIVSTVLSWHWIRPKLRSSHAVTLYPTDISQLSALPFILCFVISGGAMIYQRADLTKQFNDFLDVNSAPQYATYFFLASAPLMTILVQRRSRGLVLAIAGASVIVAYFNGIRYYMFPFVGYLVWSRFIESRTKIKPERIALIIGAVVIGWIGLTYWGILRGSGMRATPIEALSELNSQDVTESLLLGNEFSTRLAYYDLSYRMWNGFVPPRPVDEIEGTLGSMVYPIVLRPFGWMPPTSNAKVIYEIQTGQMDTGVSTGALPFGSDWVTWGTIGCALGGVIMGFLLAGFDELHARRGLVWILVGPLSAFQLIFFARGGTDVWLGLWGRAMPLSIALFIAARLLAIMRHKPVESLARPHHAKSIAHRVFHPELPPSG